MKKVILFFLLLLLATDHAFAQTASILPQGYTQYLDSNGNPLSGGKVYNYIVGTTTFKNTWQDSAEVTLNTNPVTLDAAGKAKILGQGAYRQIIRKANGDLVWDAVTSSTGSGGGSSATGDGDLVGTVKPWAGISAPNQYAFAYGQELNRVTYATLLTAITQILNLNCTATSTTISGISDTTSIRIGSPIEATCIPAGTTVVSKAASSIVVSNPASLTVATTGTFYPWGNGDGSTTFNVPDLRDLVITGRANMGGIDRGLLTTTYFGTDPTGVGSRGGSESNSTTISQANLPVVTLSTTVSVSSSQKVVAAAGVTTGAASGGGFNTYANTQYETLSATGSGNTPLGGSGTVINTSRVQPTITFNYIIKITPDTNSSVASGVTSLGNMTGDIACGTGLLCTGNTISLTAGGNFVSGPVSSTIGNISTWNNTSGTLLKDSGVNIGSAGGPVTINPTSATNTQGLIINQTSINSGSIAGPILLNTLTIIDQAQTVTGGNTLDSFGQISGQTNGIRLNYRVTGGSASHGGLSIATDITGSNGGTYAFGGGTRTNVNTGAGAYTWGGLAYGSVGASGVQGTLIGFEAEMLIATGGTVTNRIGLSVNSQGPVKGSSIDAAISVNLLTSNDPPYNGAIPFTNFTYFSNNLYGAGAQPIATTGNIFASDAMTINNFVDFNNVNIQNYIFQFPNLKVPGNIAGFVLPSASVVGSFQFGGQDSGGTSYEVNAFTGPGRFTSRRANTSSVAPSAILLDQPIGSWTAQGYNGSTGYVEIAAIGAFAAQNFTLSNNGSYIALYTVPLNSTAISEVVRIQRGLMVNTTTDPGLGVINLATGVQIAGAATSGTFLRGNGTNYVASTLTLPNTTTANQILYSSATSVVGQITTAATSALVTNSSSVPAFTSGSVANRILRTDGTTITFAQVAAATDISGLLPLANGGTNANLTASNGGIFYSTASAGAILAGTATARQMLQSGASTTPAWSTTTWPATTTINRILYSSSASVIGEITSANSSILITDSGGIPSLSTTLPAFTAGGTISGNGQQLNNIIIGTSTPLAGTFTAAIANSFVPNLSTIPTNGLYLPAANTLGLSISSAAEIQLTSTAFSPAVDGGSSLGTTALGWQNLFANTGFVLNIENSDWVATHTTGILTVGTGDLRVTTAGTNSASVVTVGGTQTLTNKSLTSPTIATPTITTSAVIPLIIGGSGTTQTLTYQTTTGVGASGADHIFLSGNNGSLQPMRLYNSGAVSIGGSTDSGGIGQVSIRGDNANVTVFSTVNGTAKSAVFQVINSTSATNAVVSAREPSSTVVQFGITLGGWAQYVDFGSTGVIFGEFGNAPMVFGTNNVERWRIAATGELVGTIATDATTTATGAIQNKGGMSVNKRVFMNGLSADTASTDKTICNDTTSFELKTGTGALGVCLGTSGAQFKTGFAPMRAGLDEISKLDLRNYYYRFGYGDNGINLQYGTTAQDIEKIIPDLVRYDTNGNPINYDWASLLFIGLHATQELNAKLKAINDNLQQRLEILERKIGAK